VGWWAVGNNSSKKKDKRTDRYIIIQQGTARTYLDMENGRYIAMIM